MKSQLTLCLTIVLCGGLFGCSTTSNRPARAFSKTPLQDQGDEIFKKIEQQFPELGSTGMNSGTSSSSETWLGEEYATAGFFLLNNHRYVSEETSRLPGMPQRTPHPDLLVTIHRYVSPGDAQQDLERGFRSMPGMRPPKQIYKGFTLYRFSSGVQRVICQSGQYIIEITPIRDAANPLVAKILDVVLVELDSTAFNSK